MKKKLNQQIIDDFMAALSPEYPNLTAACCTLECILESATELMNESRKTIAKRDAELVALRAHIAELEAAIGEHNEKMKSLPTIDPPKNVIDGLRFLAVWFDAAYDDAGTGRDTLQQDLRRWADELEAAAEWRPASELPPAPQEDGK